MQETSKVVEVNGISYEVFKFPVKESFKILIKLLKYIGGGVGQGMKGGDLSGNDKGVGGMQIEVGDMLSGLADRLDDEEAWTLVETILTYIHMKKEGGYAKINIELDFQDNFQEIFFVVWESLKFNFSRFLALTSPLLEKVGRKSPSTTSTTKTSKKT